MLYHKPSPPRRVASSLVALAFSLAAVPGLAQSAPDNADPEETGSSRSSQVEDDLHNRNVDGSGLIVVTANSSTSLPGPRWSRGANCSAR